MINEIAATNKREIVIYESHLGRYAIAKRPVGFELARKYAKKYDCDIPDLVQAKHHFKTVIEENSRVASYDDIPMLPEGIKYACTPPTGITYFRYLTNSQRPSTDP